MRKLVTGIAMFASAILLSSFAPSAAKADSAEATYKAKCQGCHGPDGKGATPAGKAMKVGDFSSDDVQKMSDADISAIISEGKGKMPASKTLSADQVKDLVAYVRTLGKKK